MQFIQKLGSCYRPPRTLLPPTTADAHGLPLNAKGSGDLHPPRRNRAHRRRSPQWRPGLSPIMEDRVTQDHQNSLNQKSDRKPSNKARSTADIPCVCSYDDRRKSNFLGMPMSVFAATPMTPFMF